MYRLPFFFCRKIINIRVENLPTAGTSLPPPSAGWILQSFQSLTASRSREFCGLPAYYVKTKNRSSRKTNIPTYRYCEPRQRRQLIAWLAPWRPSRRFWGPEGSGNCRPRYWHGRSAPAGEGETSHREEGKPDNKDENSQNRYSRKVATTGS